MIKRKQPSATVAPGRRRIVKPSRGEGGRGKGGPAAAAPPAAPPAPAEAPFPAAPMTPPEGVPETPADAATLRGLFERIWGTQRELDLALGEVAKRKAELQEVYAAVYAVVGKRQFKKDGRLFRLRYVAGRTDIQTEPHYEIRWEDAEEAVQV